MSRIAGIVLPLLIALITFEAGFAAILALSPRMSFPPNSLFRTFYLDQDRSIVIYQPGCGQYDPKLTYTFQPGSCLFKNREFAVQFDINSAGLRDDEASLIKPEIIVLGDSHASGWGIAQAETFPEKLAAATGFKVLNAAIPSYGTAREMRLLERLDTQNLKYLVIQYCNNDTTENKSYVDHRGELPITPEAEFDQIRNHYLTSRHYVPLSYTRYALHYAVRKLHSTFSGWVASHKAYTDEKIANREARHAERFLKILAEAKAIPQDTTIFIVTINDVSQDDTLFNQSLTQAMTEPAFKTNALLRRINIVDLDLTYPTHYFNLDEHINAAGHTHVADALVKAIQAHQNPADTQDSDQP